MKRRTFARLLILLLCLFAFPVFSQAEISSLQQLNAPGMKVGVSQGSAAENTVRAELPEAEIVYFTDNHGGFLAVGQGKIDGFVYELVQLRVAVNEGLSGVRILDETLQETIKIAAGLSPVSAIPELQQKINQFIAEIRANGILDEMFTRWIVNLETDMPEIPEATDPTIHLTVGTSGIVRPYSFYVGTELSGFDIELAKRFAAWLGADVQFKVYDYGAIIPAAVSGDIDVILANLNVTKERLETIPFSDILFEEKMGVLVPGEPAKETGTQTPGEAVYGTQKPSDFNGRRGGVITGSFHDSVIGQELPDATISQYATYSDMVEALKTKKIDFFLASTELASHLMEAEKEVMALSEPVRILDIGAMFAKSERGDRLKAQMDEFITRLKAEGTLEEIYRFWSDPANDSTPVDKSGLTGENGTLHFATSGTKVPISFIANGEIAGTDPDIAVRFCREYGYGIDVITVETAGLIPGLVTGMYDFSLSDMVITEERKESVNFSIPYHGTELLMMTRREEAGAAAVEEDAPDFFEQIRQSFNKTFIRENRWKLFAQGIGVTVLITFLSIVFGTALGFLIFMLCRNGNAAANGIARVYTRLVQGLPVVVLLMVLYYIIFGRLSISGITVSVLCFTMTFSSSVFGLLKMGVGMIDPGQYEAAYALGHANRHTFFRIIFPQAIPHVLAAYRGDIVALIKATSIVGYIAVQDLTKMGDIVRSRTYEAFFPLIAISVIYFVLEELFSFLVRRIEVLVNPRTRTREQILKGLETDDKD